MEDKEVGKVCTQCAVFKPLDAYTPDKRARDGRYSSCRACNKQWRSTAYHRAWRAVNEEHVHAYGVAYRAAHAAEISERTHQRYMSNPTPKKEREARRYADNPLPIRERAKAWREGNTVRHLENVRAWQQANPEQHKAHRKAIKARRRAAGGSFSGAEWRALCASYGHVCLACGETVPLTPDHIVPLSKGGSNDIDNIQPLCLRCNRRKGCNIIDYRPDCPSKMGDGSYCKEKFPKK